MVFALTAILIASIIATPAFAQSPILVSTDMPSYDDGDTIMVSGTVADLLSGYQISIQIFEPEFGNIVYINQFGVGADKKYNHQLTAGGPGWFSAGEYRVVVTYGTENRVAETTFDFSGSSTSKGKSINVEGFLVGYKITGGSVVSITPDVDSSSLIIVITTTSDGELTITLPRELIDAVLETGGDDEFFVLVDQEEVDFDETKTSTDRTLTIKFPQGAEEIEIIGTFVIPEFGAIAALILAVAIISIIVVSAKTRLSLIPRY